VETKDSTKPPSVTEKTIEPVEESVSMNMMGNCNSVPEIHAEKDTEKPRTLTASSSVPKSSSVPIRSGIETSTERDNMHLWRT